MGIIESADVVKSIDGNLSFNFQPASTSLAYGDGYKAPNSEIITEQSFVERVSDLIEDYTVDQILDTPYWSNELKEATFATLNSFEDFLMQIESVLHHELVAHDYNTFGSYVEFFRSYQRTEKNLVDFVFDYRASINVDSMSCVAMALYLLEHLKRVNPMYGQLFSLVSCEEMIAFGEDNRNNEDIYHLDSKDNVKEHVMVALKFNLVDGNRNGYVLMDPGYHICRPLVVMHDGAYPHTGWFVSSNNGKVKKEFCYQVLSSKFITWTVKEQRLDCSRPKSHINIIYVEREFIKYASVTEKRALIFSMKSYVIRNRKGPVSGFYSWINAKNLVIFYEMDGRRVNQKFMIDQYDQQCVRDALTIVASQKENDPLSLEERVEQFINMLRMYQESLNDKDFCPDLLEIDKFIED
ncbi:hypothetical protein BLOT_006456 [Blomia tropicalis]|nr:hypothetical protein BLOT_006456 [Blomia tropicalis]